MCEERGTCNPSNICPDLDHADGAGSGLEVSEVGLDGPDVARAADATVLLEEFAHGIRLDGVARRRART